MLFYLAAEPTQHAASRCFFRINSRIRLLIPSDAAIEQFSGLALLIVRTRPVKQSPIVPNDEVANLPFVFVNSRRLASKRFEFS